MTFMQPLEAARRRRILIVEDHALLRAGLKALLVPEADLEVVGEAEDGRDALRAVVALKPDLVLMDLSMPGMGGIEAIAEIRRRSADARILVLTIHKADEYVHAALCAGANGYVLKEATHGELRAAIRAVLAGKTFLSPDVSGHVVTSYVSGRHAPVAACRWDGLTHREREVLKLVAEGHGNRHIAEYLSLSVKTVEKHRANLMKKLGLHNAAGLTVFAIECGLLGVQAPPPPGATKT